MAVGLFVLAATDNTVATLDDASQDHDQGGAVFDGMIVTGKFSAAGNAYAHFRNFLQQLFIKGTCLITVTPITNDQEVPTAAQDVPYNIGLPALDGPSVQVEVPFYQGGVDHQVKIEILYHLGGAQLGGAEMWLVPRRQKPL